MMYIAITKKRYFDSEENGAYDCQNRLKVSLFPFQNVMIFTNSCKVIMRILYLSRDLRFPLMWYVRQTKAQTRLSF